MLNICTFLGAYLSEKTPHLITRLLRDRHNIHELLYVLSSVFYFPLSQNCEKPLLASSCQSVCPPVRLHGITRLPLDDFNEFWYWRIFLKSVEKFKVLLVSDKNNGHFTWRPTYILIISRSFLLRMRNVSNKTCRENQNTHFVFSNPFFPKMMLLWDNVEKYFIAGQATDDSMVHARCMLAAGYLRLQIHTLKLCNNHGFSLQQRLNERASVLCDISTLPILLIWEDQPLGSSCGVLQSDYAMLYYALDAKLVHLLCAYLTKDRVTILTMTAKVWLTNNKGVINAERFRTWF